jgi:hypothetical protein
MKFKRISIKKEAKIHRANTARQLNSATQI